MRSSKSRLCFTRNFFVRSDGEWISTESKSLRETLIIGLFGVSALRDNFLTLIPISTGILADILDDFVHTLFYYARDFGDGLNEDAEGLFYRRRHFSECGDNLVKSFFNRGEDGSGRGSGTVDRGLTSDR